MGPNMQLPAQFSICVAQFRFLEAQFNYPCNRSITHITQQPSPIAFLFSSSNPTHLLLNRPNKLWRAHGPSFTLCSPTTNHAQMKSPGEAFRTSLDVSPPHIC
ncbi:hypothetical protein Droror1_Dr00022044 [Drosera rotundifolia]